jgi:hypothetical protein
MAGFPNLGDNCPNDLLFILNSRLKAGITTVMVAGCFGLTGLARVALLDVTFV